MVDEEEEEEEEEEQEGYLPFLLPHPKKKKITMKEKENCKLA